MGFLKQFEIDQFKEKIATDLSTLGRLHKAKKSRYITKSVDHSLVDDMLKKGWEEFGRPLKTKTKLRKEKPHDKQFEDDVWCQFYGLGYRMLNYDQNFILPYGKTPKDKKQIDVVAIDEETIFLIECKSSGKPKKVSSLKTEFEGLEKRLDGFKKSLEQAFGKGKKIKYIFATRKLRISNDSVEIKRLLRTNSFYYNDNTYEYINSLIKSYKSAAKYQLFGLLFKNQLINNDKVEVPAVEGDMGGKKYYMFSIEPYLLLKMGFILHRTKANESEMPTYQRLLVPSRLKKISKFITEGGFFPNSIILNFTQRKHKVTFEASARSGNSRSRFGMLKIPNAYALAYIIDGQHRVYGYAETEYKESNTVPVVAFLDLTATEQLEIFMDINQNQKAVSPSLRLTLEEDLYWNADRVDSRLKALRSGIIKELAEDINGPLYSRISIGEDASELAFRPFATALIKCGLLPVAKGNNYDSNTTGASFYNINKLDHNKEMLATKKKVVDFVNLCYGYVEEDFPEIYEKYIISNRGTYAFISLIGSLNRLEFDLEKIDKESSPEIRFEAVKKYLTALLNRLKDLKKEEEETMLSSYGTGADIRWFRFYQSLVNAKFSEYEPAELVDWKERQDEELQNEGRKYGVEIEKKIKKLALSKIKSLFNENWELEINSIKRECIKRAEEEKERYYKEGLGKKDVHWTEMFNINDYKSIITKYWTKIPQNENEKSNFVTFQDEFSIDIGDGFNSKSDRIRWISYFNSYRNLWAHEGTKEKRLNKEEVSFLQRVHSHFYST
ncbi:DGQHR domain-containing protein [Ulvibacterium marinum]|uniref:DGQHR domain-containing protein n=1 Tax=Ulvibacterium marinum TaxID=2419782 RepID=A0A3B0C9Y2_9FLAO|nr:DGQHR domain-containing protein [Ulvibacterium marinum]RKN79566.1 DGQHR domain-containing protein [Ulvibacterium marinum]